MNGEGVCWARLFFLIVNEVELTIGYPIDGFAEWLGIKAVGLMLVTPILLIILWCREVFQFYDSCCYRTNVWDLNIQKQYKN